ncbi:hypothetical protein [Streptomyces macrosporus]|uniref:hypothetical protein n=1 Tax=Streptomyces macrosporus TaxID=44032 RepID=UPI0031DDB836
MTRTGGIAGGYTSVVVDRDGAVEVLDAPGGTPETDRMPRGELAELRGLLESEEFESLPRRTIDRQVPDAFVYEFVTPGHAVLADDLSLRDPLRDVLELVGPWLDGGTGQEASTAE